MSCCYQWIKRMLFATDRRSSSDTVKPVWEFSDEFIVYTSEERGKVVPIYDSTYIEKVANDDCVARLFGELRDLRVSQNVMRVFWLWTAELEDKQLILAIEKRIANDRRRIENGGEEKVKANLDHLLNKCREVYTSMLDVEKNNNDFSDDREYYHWSAKAFVTVYFDHLEKKNVARQRSVITVWMLYETQWKREATTKLALINQGLEKYSKLLKEFLEDLKMYDAL